MPARPPALEGALFVLPVRLRATPPPPSKGPKLRFEAPTNDELGPLGAGAGWGRGAGAKGTRVFA